MYYGPTIKSYIALDINDQKTILGENKNLIKLCKSLEQNGYTSNDYIISYKFNENKKFIYAF